MKARLESTKARYEELDKKLIDYDVLADMNVFKALSKEKASIEDIVNK
jgi:protein subunit release factor A